MAELPLLERFPALGAVPRAAFGSFPTPVQSVLLDSGTLMVKRDDLSSALVGGNKVRGLEWLLGDVGPEDTVLTVGPLGSTHALATAACARRLGASVTVVRWNQQMNPAARRVAARTRQYARVIEAGWIGAAYALAGAQRLARRGVRWIPAGGASPLAMLGHVNAALELAAQIGRGEIERPERVVVPLGTGTTAAGLALGFRIADLRTRVVAVRVVPRLLGRRARLRRLAAAAARLIERHAATQLPRLRTEDLVVEHRYYGGRYGRPIAVNDAALAAAGIALDDTYGRKAFAAATRDSAATLLWLTFDGRLLQD